MELILIGFGVCIIVFYLYKVNKNNKNDDDIYPHF